MRTEIDCATLSPKEFATTVGRWIQLLARPGKPTEKMRDARSAAGKALESAASLERQELFEAIAQRDGAAAMLLAAQEGQPQAIERLHAAGVDCDATTKSSMGITPLLYAAQGGHTDAALKLLDCGAELNKHEMGVNALGTAIKNGHHETAWAILNRTDDASKLKHMRGTILECVARYGGAEFVPALVERGVSPDTPDSLQKPPIAYAVEERREDVVRALLDAGASPNLPYEEKPTRMANPFLAKVREPPLVIAVMKGDQEIFELLLDAGADPSVKDGCELTAYDWARRGKHDTISERLRALLGLPIQKHDVFDTIKAARLGDLETIKQAIAEGVDIDFCPKPGRSALMMATVNGQVESAQLLVEAGASPEKTERGVSKPLSSWQLAAKHDHLAILKLFQHHHADSKCRGPALVTAAKHGSVESAAYLLKCGVDANSRNSEHHTALIAAAKRGEVDMLDLLIRNGADLERRDKGMFASTALHSAMLLLNYRESIEDENGNLVNRAIGNPIACIKLLIESGADPNSIARHGDFPLQYPDNCPEVTRMLIDAGADLSIVDKVYQQTALHWAVRHHDFESAEMLLKAGSQASPVDKEGRTPLDLARKYDLIEIAKLIEDAGGVSGMETEVGRAAIDEKFAAELSDRKRREAAIAASEALQPDFSSVIKSANYLQAVKRLEEITGATHESPEHAPALACCKAELQRAKELIEAERKAFRELGCTLFRCGKAFLEDDELLGILPTTDPFEVIAAMGVAGPNYDVFPSEIVSELKDLYELVPFNVTLALYDTVELELEKPIPKAQLQKWSNRLYKLCPDLVDQGFLSKRKLREHMAKETSLFLWWD